MIKSRLLEIFFTTIYLASIALWLHIDRAPPTWDPAFHLLSAYRISSLETSFKSLMSDPYPPLTRFLCLPLLPFKPSSDLLTFYMSGISIWTILLSFIGLAKHFKGSFNPLLSISIVFLSPLFSGMTRSFWIDIPLSASFALFLYALFSYIEEPSKTRAFTLGLAFSIGGLIKWSFFVYALPSLMVLRSKWSDSKIFFRASILPPLFLLLPWYSIRFISLIRFAVWNYGMGRFEGDPPFYTIEGILYYIKVIPYMTSPILLIPIIIGLVRIVGLHSPYRSTLFSSILIPYLIFTFIHNKDPRYLIPAIIPLSIIGGSSITSSKKRKAIIPCLTFIILLSMIQHTLLLWTKRYFFLYPFPRDYFLSKVVGSPIPDPFVPYPLTEDWKLERVADTIIRSSQSKTEPVIIAANSIFFNDNSLLFELLRRGFRGNVFRYYPDIGIEKRMQATKGEMVIILSGRTYIEDNLCEEDLKKIDNFARMIEKGRGYRSISKERLPNGMEITIYKEMLPIRHGQ